MDLSREEIRRYSRHLVLPEVGVVGQEKLKAGSVLIVGLGGLGSPLAMYLAAAGVGRIGLVDFDRVEVTNLQRQVLYGENDLGRDKVEAAAERLREINPHVHLELHGVRLTRENALDILGGYDCIADGTDNFATRYLVNDACVLLNKPNIYGSILRFEGQCSIFGAPGGPCYRCLFPEPPPPGAIPSCAEGGVLGVLPGVIGSLQGMEVLKTLLGTGDTLVGRLLLFDGLEMSFRSLKIERDPKCPVCGDHPRITELLDYDELCSGPSASTANPEAARGVSRAHQDIQVEELDERLRNGTAPVIIDVREIEELEICRLEGVHHFPLGDLLNRIGELDPQMEVVALCHHGYRSAYAVALLRQARFVNARNLVGGIEAWAARIDRSMARY